MKITDIIRGVLDIVDRAQEQEQSAPAVHIAVAKTTDEHDLDDLKSLAGIDGSSRYANEPYEMTAPTGAAFPGGDDVHARKNPADIRADSISMYPDWLAREK